MRDGHGDLRAEHVVLERGIEIVDCVEFDPALREIDVGLDLAFLVMDLLRRDERLAAALVSAYRAAGGDPGDDALVSFFAAQRALIRAKVALVRAGQVERADAARRRADAESLLALADRLGWRVRIGPAVVVSGPAASGKSTLAATIGERAGGARAVVRSRPQGAPGSRADGSGARERLRAGRQPPDLRGARAAHARWSAPASAWSSMRRSASGPTARRSSRRSAPPSSHGSCAAPPSRCSRGGPPRG